MSQSYRIERDSLGEVRVPEGALFGAQTQRAVENFPISGQRLPRPFLEALGWIKEAAAVTNGELGLLAPGVARAIAEAAQEVAAGRWDDQFVVDVYQTGSGTSTHMNANEVIARRAAEILGVEASEIHPNDHVNRGQSSNDVFPTAIHVAAKVLVEKDLLPALRGLAGELRKKAKAFREVVKSGRTHLMDATPVTLGQEFGGWARQVELGVERIREASDGLLELPLGGTATGTGINTPSGFAARAIARISTRAGFGFREAADHFEAQGARDAAVHVSGALNTVAAGLMKIADDLRWLASGPTSGLREIRLPSLQPGSSIMPGKVNPVLCEALMMVAARVMGNHTTITVAGSRGNFELNVMMPVLAHALLESITLLARAARTFSERCVAGIEADPDRCRELVEGNPSLATALAPLIGYDAAAEVAKEAVSTGKTVREVAVEKGYLSEREAEDVLDPLKMTGSGGP